MLKVITSALALAAIFATVPAFAVGQEGATVPTQATAEAETRQSAWYGKPFAIGGQDPVSFQTATGPIAGSEEFTTNWDNTEWRFSSAENRDEFLRDPARYAPQFGGYCPVALSRDHALAGSPEHYAVIDDKLYLNYNKRTNNSFENNPIGYISANTPTF